MPWVNITNNDVLAVLNSTELTAYDNFRPALSQADPLATLISHVTNEIRGVIRRRHTLDAGGGIPTSLVGAACAMIVYRLLLRCSARPADGRKLEYDDAFKLLDRVARGDFGIEMPAQPVTELTSGPTPLAAPRRHWKHREE